MLTDQSQAVKAWRDLSIVSRDNLQIVHGHLCQVAIEAFLQAGESVFVCLLRNIHLTVTLTVNIYLQLLNTKFEKLLMPVKMQVIWILDQFISR